MKVEDFLKTNKQVIKNIKYKITKTKEKEDCVLIFLDNNEKIYVSVDLYFKYGLNALQGLDDKLYETLLAEQKLFLAYRGCLKKLSIKDYSCKQISDYLKLKHDLDNNEIKEIVEQLIKYDLLNDERFAENKASRLANQLLSAKQIKTKLKKDGIDNELIEKYAIINVEDELVKAIKLAAKYSNSIKNKSLNATKQSILTKLVNSGYSYEVSKQALDSLCLVSKNEIDLLKKEYNKAKLKYEKKYEGYDLNSHIYAYLINKGFKTDDIKSVLEV